MTDSDYKLKRNKAMKHMGQDERNRIEFSLGCRMSVADIAKALGRSESTISRELINRRIDSDKHYGCSNRLCARFDECQRMIFNGFKEVRRKNTPGCFESCPDFRAKMNGLSREMIIHPGETLKEVLEDRETSQQELALRTGVTPKHIRRRPAR